MQRTQIYLPEDLRREIDLAANKEKKPAAQIIREILEAGIHNRRQQTTGEALAGLARLKVNGGPPDLSKNIDKYLYK